MALPASSGIVLPIDYSLSKRGPVLEQATVQLLDYDVRHRALTVITYSHGPGELVLMLPSPPAAATLDGATIALGGKRRRRVRFTTAPGEHELVVTWGK